MTDIKCFIIKFIKIICFDPSATFSQAEGRHLLRSYYGLIITLLLHRGNMRMEFEITLSSRKSP